MHYDMSEIPTTVKNKDLVEKRRRQIVMAAIKLFALNGFHKTTLKELAEEAGLSHGNIYDYVGGKEDIFFLIHDFLAGSAMDLIRRSLEDVQDPIERLRRIVRAEFKLMDQWSDALLLIYQESHILKGDFLKKLLHKERLHLAEFENVINDCIAKGRLKECDVRLVANLIKSMIDSWALKRWDLRGHVNQLDVERTILEITLDGLSRSGEQAAPPQPAPNSLEGKTVFLANGGTVIGQALGNALRSKGARLITQTREPLPEAAASSSKELPTLEPACIIDNQARITAGQMREIEERYGPIDIYIHDLGIGIEDDRQGSPAEGAASRLDDNLQYAHELAGYFKTRMSASGSGRIIYLAPWSWDRYADAIRFETARAAAVAMSRAMARELAETGVNVNCVIPGYIRAPRPLKIEKKFGSQATSEIPSGRLGELFDVIATVSFLIGDGAKYITGQVLKVTGGQD